MTLEERIAALEEALGTMAEADRRMLNEISAIGEELRDPGLCDGTSGHQTSWNVKKHGGVIYGVSGRNGSGGTRHIFLFDWPGDSPPPNGSADWLIDVISDVATATSFDREYNTRGRRFERGLWIVSSSTINNLTIGTTATEMLAFAAYR